MNLNNIFGNKTYEIKTRCKNCRTKQLTKIKKGNKPEDVLWKGACSNCGVRELEVIK